MSEFNEADHPRGGAANPGQFSQKHNTAPAGLDSEQAPRRYSNRDEAVNSEIASVIDAGDDTSVRYDVDAIADKVLAGFDDGYVAKASGDEFWRAVADGARPVRLRWFIINGNIDPDGTFGLSLERDDAQDGSFSTEIASTTLTFDGDSESFEADIERDRAEDDLLASHALTRSDLVDILTV